MMEDGPHGQISREAKLWHSTAEMLKYINGVHQTSYSAVRRLPGGFGSETYLVLNESGQKAVLKWDRRKNWADKVTKAAPVVLQARAAGWPTPEWFVYGASPSGYSYVIQDYVALKSGSHERILDQLASAAVDFLESKQTGINLDTDDNWAAWDRAVVFECKEKCSQHLREHSPEGALLIDTIEPWITGFKDVHISTSDLVHGDFQPGNFLLADKESIQIDSVIDVEALGKGSRFHDLADLACHNIIWQGRATVLHILDKYAKAHANPGEWEISFVARLYELLYFYIFLFHGDAPSRLQSAMAAIRYIQNHKE